MKIRNIITSAAIAIVLGLSGVSAFADYEENLETKYGSLPSADSYYPGKVFVYNDDTDTYEGEVFTEAQTEEHLVSEADQETLQSGG